MKKKLIAALFCATTMLCLLPATAFATTDLSGEVSGYYSLDSNSEIRAGQTFSINSGAFPQLALSNHTLDIYGTLKFTYTDAPAIIANGGTVNNYGMIKVVANSTPPYRDLNVNNAIALYNYGTIDTDILYLNDGSILYGMTLSSLALSSGTLSPAFAAGTRDYTATVDSGVASVNITPTLNNSTHVASITVNGLPATSGSSSTVNLEYGPNTIPIVITASDTAGTTNTYTLTVTRTPLCSINITTQPVANTAVTEGRISGSLSAAATVTNSGTPTYNWYQCDASGAVSGSSLASTTSFAIPTSLTAGTYHYLCQVTADGAIPVNSSVATITVSAPALYQITQGANGTWTKSGSTGLAFTADADYSKLASVSVDGSQIASDKYTSAPGSTVVTLKATYLETLSAGQHTLQMSFTDGYAETSFTVNATAKSVVPKTGDSSASMLWTGILLLVGAGLIVGGAICRRRQDG